jgi:hypothetical protein
MRLIAVRSHLPVQLLGMAITGLSSAAYADFIDDSSATLSTNNIYFNRDFRDGDGQNKREEWGQGFLLDVKSGYTDGTVGMGVDALGMLGIKLDSGGGRTGTDLLPVQDDGGTPDQFARLGLTAKFKVSATELRYGSHIPELPVIKASTSRLLPQILEGGMLTSSEWSGLKLTGARFNRAVDRASTNAEKIALNSKNKRYAGGITADHMNIAGAEYEFSKGISGSYFYADVQDIYRQHYFGLTTNHAFGPGKFSSDLRLSMSKDSGSAKAGKVDNQALQAMFSYSLGGHKFGLGYQDMGGDTGFTYLDGSDPFLINFVQINDFANAGERSWQARYDYDFTALGIPGLSFMSRYLSGEDARIAGSDKRGSEWERNSEVRYVVQSGPLRNVSIRLRNATFRSQFARNADENRIIVGYSLPIW